MAKPGGAPPNPGGAAMAMSGVDKTQSGEKVEVDYKSVAIEPDVR